MTKKQKKEAHKLFELCLDDIPEYEHAEYEKCFQALSDLFAKFGDIFTDCTMYLANKREMEAEEHGNTEAEKTLHEALLDAELIWGKPGNA